MENILEFGDWVNESLVNQRSLDQFKKISDLSKESDIGNRISNAYRTSQNVLYVKGLENVDTYEEWMKKSKKFKSGWNARGEISPF